MGASMSCPCGAEYGWTPEVEGRTFTCPRCGRSFLAPGRETMVQRRKGPGVGGRIGSILSMPTALLLGLFFFLPWLAVSCDSPTGGKVELVTSTGWQLTRGRMSEGSGMRQLRESLSKMNASGTTAGVPQSPSSLEETKSIRARPLCILGLVVPLLVLGTALAATIGKPGPLGAGGLLLLLAVLGIVVLVQVGKIDLVSDMQAAQAKEPQDSASTVTSTEDAKGIKTEAGAAMYLSGLGYVFVGLCAVINLIVGLVKRGGAVRGHAFVPAPSPGP